MGSGEANADTELRKNRKQKERANTGLWYKEKAKGRKGLVEW